MGLDAGVIGTGRLGREHVRLLANMSGVSAVHCFDALPDRAAEVAAEHGARAAASAEELVGICQAVCVVVPTTQHARFAALALERQCDVFVEKPIASTVAEAEAITRLAERQERIVQVGHVERFNGAFRAVEGRIETPSFIEIHRLSPFTVRGTDISVVGDLMIHDLDLLFCILGEAPVEVRAAGAGVLTAEPDIVNARLEYAGGCVANVTASRVSVEPMRKVRIFSPSRYVSVDLLNRRATEYRKSAGYEEAVARLASHGGGYEGLGLDDFIEFERFDAAGQEPLRSELEAFIRSVESRCAPEVSGIDGLKALRLAESIVEAVRRRPGG